MTGIVGIYVGKEAREGQLKETTQRVLRQPGYNGLLSRKRRARDRMERLAVLLLARWMVLARELTHKPMEAWQGVTLQLRMGGVKVLIPRRQSTLGGRLGGRNTRRGSRSHLRDLGRGGRTGGALLALGNTENRGGTSTRGRYQPTQVDTVHHTGHVVMLTAEEEVLGQPDFQEGNRRGREQG